MTNDELIAKQSLKIAEQEEIINEMKESCRNVCMKIVCIGGPLNDNKLKYSNEQLKIFSFIVNELDYYG